MDDQRVNDKTSFEPPPWEQEAFEALAARRADERMAREALEAAATSPAAPIQEPDEAPAAAVPLIVTPGAVPVATAADASPARPATDERVVKAMLVQLQNEERVDKGATKWVAIGASVFTAALGLAMLVAGVVMIGKSGGTSLGAISSGVLTVFGLSFIGMASWVWITTSRSRGR